MILERIIVGPLEVNCYLLAAGHGGEAVVIDPGGDGETILERIREFNLTVRYILNTHGHFDHVGANRLIREETGAEILIHEKDAPLLALVNEQAQLFGLEAENSPPPDRFFVENERIQVGELALRILFTPGHSEGGICILQGRNLFTGDTLFAGSIGRTDLAGGSFRDIMISIQNSILPLGDHMVLYPGHGPSSTIRRERLTNPYLAELGQR